MEKLDEMATAKEFAEMFVENASDRKARRKYYGLGTVQGFGIEGGVVVYVDGQLEGEGRSRRYLSSYSPRRGDRVLILEDVVVGKIK